MKDFENWFPLKEKLDTSSHKVPFVSEGDIWWMSIGENIGSEISGKNSLFSRPAIIYKKLSHSFYLIIPTTTKEKDGSWYVPFTQGQKNMVACLQQVRTVDYRRLSSKLGSLDQKDFERVQIGFSNLYLK